MNKRDKLIEEARERYEKAQEYWSEIYARVREDLEFSDPTNPRQWPDSVRREREQSEGGPRPCMTFDLTGQYVRQVINTARRNKPAIKYLPVDDKSDPRLAEVLQGLARQTEYASRAEVAYIHALAQATRGGLGFFRLVLEEVPNAQVVGQQCAKIQRVADFETVLLDPDYVEPDGSDCRYGFVEEVISREEFTKRYPKAKAVDFDDGGWFSDDEVRLCEYYRVKEETTTEIVVDGQQISEEQYQALMLVDPSIPAVQQQRKKRTVEHFKISGEEILEESIFPAEHIPLFPVTGNEEWADGKRNLGGCVRPAKDAQISYNLSRNAEAEATALGPKAPWYGPAEAIEGYENIWKRANAGNIGFLPFNSLDEAGNPITPPQRVQPAGMQAGWIQLREAAKADVQSALGMFNASVGDNPNNQSGRAVLALQDKADLGSYHYVDNLALSIAHCGRVLTQVWPAIYDQAQIVRIIGEDEEPQFVRVDPQAPQAYSEQQGQVVINPTVGRYDVRVTVGPTYLTRQTEAAATLGEVVNGNPQMMALLGDLWFKAAGFPDSDKVSRRLMAMLPPQVQAAERGEQQLPPEVQGALQNAAQEIQQLQAALQEAQQSAQVEMLKAQTQIRVAEMNNDTKRDIEELRGMVQILIQQMQPPTMLANEVADDLGEGMTRITSQ